MFILNEIHSVNIINGILRKGTVQRVPLSLSKLENKYAIERIMNQ